MEESSSILTVEFKPNLLAPGNGDLLIGRSRGLKNGRNLTICESEVFVLENDKEKLCAAAQSTFIELKNQADN